MADPFSSLMEAYSSIRTSVDFAVPGDHRVLNITSSQPSEGKSLSSLILARKYASLGYKTIVIDADLRRPGLSYLANGKRPSIGFVEVLLGDATLDRAMIHDATENLHVLPIAGIPNNPVELLSSARLRDFVDKLRQDYQMVIFDTPPVMGLADSPLMSRIVDATVFVIEANRAHFGQAKVALRRLRTAGAKIAGVVLTKHRAETDGSYYYNQNYYYQYGDKQPSA
jgi:capsular exopolysaccharide synthesis family protein